MQNKLLLHGLTYSRKSKSLHVTTPRAHSSDAVRAFQRVLSEADDTTPEGKELFEIWETYEDIYAKHKRTQKLLGDEAVEEGEDGEDLLSDGEEEDEGPNEYDLNDEFIDDAEVEQKKTKAQREADLNAEIELAERRLEQLRSKRSKISSSDDLILFD